MSNKQAPQFSRSLLHPKYWGVWLGFGFLALIVNLLPYSLSFSLGRSLGTLIARFGEKRVRTAKTNVKLVFPDKSQQEVEEFVDENIKNSGLALIETGIAWFWPSWRFKRLLVKQDLSALEKHEANGKGVLLCCVHALNLEMTGRAFAELGMHGYGVFRPHDNPAYNFIQYWGRTSYGNSAIDRKDLKAMIRVLRKGSRLFYLPDHDYGRRKSVFVPFFTIEDACTTTGTSILAYTSRCAIVIGSGFRNNEGKYNIIADQSIEDNFPQKDEVAAAAYMNTFVEKVILRAPEQWMWMHRRFKNHPDRSIKNSRYKNQ
ncbi:LpxL/LpxP family Kdo(2)-lipid IV(A) lauroyl/palmitoleoyl acyltransferase [Vibrio sp. WJH972]